MKMAEGENEGTMTLHNVRFYNLPPRAINCLSYNRHSAKLALSREGGTVEIWDLSYAAFLEKQIPNEKSSIECLGWAGNRLFSAGLSGEVVEWNLVALKREPSISVTGMAVWCLDIDRAEKCMVVGTEAGYLNAFNIDEGGLVYKNLFDKQEGRIICCKFDRTGNFVVTGSIDVIRIWDAKTGHALHKMTMGRSDANVETIVWSLQVLKDFTIIAGDSRGQLTIWDGKLGAQIECHKAARADVLAVAINEEEDILICSGIDPIIRIYSLTEIKKSDQMVKKWIKFFQRDLHAHDVKALACAGNYVVSGGIDGYLGISSFAKTMESTIVKHGPFLQSPCASIAPEKRLMLLQYITGLEIWSLGTALDRAELSPDESEDTDDEANEEKEEKRIMLLGKMPEKLVELHSVHDDAVVCTALAPNGQIVAYSTTNAIRIFVLKREKGKKADLTRIKGLPESFLPCSKMIFSRDSKYLFLVHAGVNHIDVFNILSEYEIDYSETIDVSRVIKDVVHLLTISHCGNYLVVAGTCRKISVWKKSNKQWEHYFNLPRYLAPTTAIAMHYSRPRVVATFTDGKIFEYDLDEMRFTCSSKELFSPSYRTHCVSNIVLCEKNDGIFILHNDSTMYVLRKNEDSEESQSSKQAKTESEMNTTGLKMLYRKSFEHFVHLARLSKNEVVMVGVNPVSLMEKLPPVMKQKRFGCM